MKLIFLLVLALTVVARSEKVCKFDDGQDIIVSDNFDCESYALARAESFRWEAIRIRIREILDRLFPTPPPDVNHEQCPADGIKQISHPDSCEKYILCVNGNEVKRRCAPGFHFSRKLMSCVNPDIANCKESERVWECPREDISGNPVFIPNTENCQKYYLCMNGDQISLRCPDGFHWSIDDQMCLPKMEANCEFKEEGEENGIEECPNDGIKSISHPDNCDKYVLCVNGARIKRNCPPGFHFSRDLRNCVKSDNAGCKEDKLECPREDDLANLVFLPDPDNCGNYFLCFGGQPIQLSCADGLHWSVENELCMEKKEAGCKKFDDDVEQCPDDGIKSISHPDNCEKYVLCVFGSRIKRNCPPGLHFSRETKSCAAPKVAECKATTLICPEEDDLGNLVFLPNKEDCSMYYVCLGGKPIPLACGDGRHWSTRENTCLKKSEAKCEFEDDEGVEQCPEIGMKQISHPDNCEKYILCFGGIRIKRNCPPGFHFSRDSRMCMAAKKAGCENEDEERLECPEIDDLGNLVFLPNPKDCGKYYLCFGGEQISLSCSDGLHWSVEEQNCVSKRKAGCEKFDDNDDIEECPEQGVKSISHPHNCEKFILCISGTRIEQNCPSGMHFSREFRSCVAAEIAGCKEAETKLQCPEIDDLGNLVFLPNPDFCNKFFFCFGGQPIPMTCADGLHWSAADQTCTTKKLAGCEVPEDFIEECPATGVKPISHPYNCEKYVLCVTGSRIKRNCPPGFHFSRNARSCKPAEIADCEDSALTCPKKDDLNNLIHLPNTENCGEYFVCFGGNKFPLACGDGLHWSVAEQNCLKPSKAMCDFNSFEQCPDFGIEHLSHPVSCEKYILCVGGARVELSCPFGLHYSRLLSSCVQPDIANCVA